MQNIQCSVEDGKLVLRIDLDGNCGTTKGGNVMVATSDNWSRIPQIGNNFSFNMVLVKK